MKGEPLSLTVITNPRAGRNRRRSERLDHLLGRYENVTHYRAETPVQLVEAAARVRAAPPDVLAINAGDGTVALVLGLLQDDPPQPFPALALIAGGTTNMNAADIGLGGRPTAALSRLIAHCRQPAGGHIRTRPLLRVQADDGAPHYGFFLGAGLISRAVALSRQRRARARWPALVPPLLTLNLLGALLRGDRRLAAPLPMALEVDGGQPQNLAVQALFATSLHTLLLGLHPFPEAPPAGHLHWGATRPGIGSPWRILPAFLRGRPHPGVTPENGYHRGCTRQLVLHFRGHYTVDGELYPVTSRLRLEATDNLRFLRL